MVRAAGRCAGRSLEFPPLQLLRACGQRGAATCAGTSGSSISRPFTKHEVTGPGAEAWLDGLVANKVPTKIGRIALCHALTRRGGIRSEFTITKIAEQHYYVVSAGAAERYDSDYLLKQLPQDGSVTLRNITMSRGCFVVAGPRSREVLAQAHRCASGQCLVPVAHRPGDAKSGLPPMCTCCA